MHRMFTKMGFAKVQRFGDANRFKIRSPEHRHGLVQAAVDAAAKGQPTFSAAHAAYVRGRQCLSIKSYSETLILRALAHYLVRRAKVAPKNRDDIVREVIESLGDSTPFYIIRRDIKSFYENVPTEAIQQKTLHSALLPGSIRAYLRAFFQVFCGQRGVPRGVGLSAVIAEMAMKDLDQKITDIPGIYKYFRYSDDILIFSFLESSAVSNKIAEILEGAGLELNISKSRDIAVAPTLATGERRKFEYLGYSFEFPVEGLADKPRPVSVSIAAKKINRIKTRIFCSLRSYKADNDFPLLVDRMRFMSGNYKVYRAGAVTIKDSAQVRSGLFYNYHLCGQYSGSVKSPPNCSELKALDGFYYSLLRSKRSEFANLFSDSFGPPRIRQLRNISFYKGFEKRLICRLSSDRVAQVKAGWRNE